MRMKKSLSRRTLKCLENNIGETAALEIYNLINDLTIEIEILRRTKVDVTPIIKDPIKIQEGKKNASL
jgi:hypothetical protein